MRRAIFLASVKADLIAILDHVAEASGSVSTAERFVGALRAQCHKLAGLAAMVGRPRPELGSDIRSFPFRGYVIFFRYRGERFEVIDILHGRRDIDAFFAEPDDP